MKRETNEEKRIEAMQTKSKTTKLLPGMLLCICLLGTGWAHAQNTDPLFAGVDQFSKNSTNTTDVNLDKNTLALAGMGKHDDGVAKKMDYVSVHTFEYPKEGDYNKNEVAKIRQRLDNGDWKRIVHETSPTESTDVCMKTGDEGEWSELVVITAEPKALTFVHLKGHLSLSDLSKFTGGKGGDAPDPALQHRAPQP
jgi:hypothetical protein